MVNRLQSGFLVADPSLVSGAARLLDWWGLYDAYNVSRNGQEADAKAMFADWRIVGQDLADAMVEFEATQPVK
jgi:hypothetical protein